jgi:hypothetical protein
MKGEQAGVPRASDGLQYSQERIDDVTLYKYLV